MLDEIYKEIKAKWNELRLARADPDILKFLVHLMEMRENSDMLYLEFPKEEMGEICEYADILGVDSPRFAVMNAIRIIMDEEMNGEKRST